MSQSCSDVYRSISSISCGTHRMFSTLFVCEGRGLFLVALLLHILFILEAEPHHQLGSIACNVAYTYTYLSGS